MSIKLVLGMFKDVPHEFGCWASIKQSVVMPEEKISNF